MNRLDPFSITTHVFKTVEDHPIKIDVCVPKSTLEKRRSSSHATNAKCPIILRYHAGWLFGGQRDYPNWFAQWVCDLAVKHDAILVSADYRLLPEATCEEALDDIMDAYIWLSTGLSDALKSSYKDSPSDLSFLINLPIPPLRPLRNPNQSPNPEPYTPNSPTSPSAPHTGHNPTPNKSGTPPTPLTLITSLFTSISHSTALNNGKRPIVSNIPMVSPTGQFLERAIIATAAEQHGRTLDFFGPERDTRPGKRRVFPEDRIVDGRVLPPVVFIHGTEDSIAPVEGMDLFVELVRKHKAVAGMKEEEGGREREEGEVMRYCRVPGEHFVATDMKLDGSEPGWLRDSVEFLEANWLGVKSARL
ncbi:alpha beta-hydrolase [Pyrrhoderma noxium]|uniref:Alpha beta-hydrolase n=1 Tax=Pyrrhoderma noxium TaxID=2282107 RepID=A0A286UI87_9AGAM|nr:alpha beta-hydrolase [Pyrrhoderma noxium]